MISIAEEAVRNRNDIYLAGMVALIIFMMWAWDQ